MISCVLDSNALVSWPIALNILDRVALLEGGGQTLSYQQHCCSSLRGHKGLQQHSSSQAALPCTVDVGGHARAVGS